MDQLCTIRVDSKEAHETDSGHGKSDDAQRLRWTLGRCRERRRAVRDWRYAMASTVPQGASAWTP